MRVIIRDTPTAVSVVKNQEVIMTTINDHEECIKSMQTFMELVAEMSAIIKGLISSKEKLITLMCKECGYPESLAKEIIHNLDTHS